MNLITGRYFWSIVFRGCKIQSISNFVLARSQEHKNQIQNTKCLKSQNLSSQFQVCIIKTQTMLIMRWSAFSLWEWLSRNFIIEKTFSLPREGFYCLYFIFSFSLQPNGVCLCVHSIWNSFVAPDFTHLIRKINDFQKMALTYTRRKCFFLLKNFLIFLTKQLRERMSTT